jgi:hypothetical protein
LIEANLLFLLLPLHLLNACTNMKGKLPSQGGVIFAIDAIFPAH